MFASIRHLDYTLYIVRNLHWYCLTCTRETGIKYMIKSFKDKEAQKICNQSVSTKMPARIQKVALRKLIMIDNAGGLEDLRIPPGNRLEILKGDRAGQYSIRINDQYRICFRMIGDEVTDVEIVDYH